MSNRTVRIAVHTNGGYPRAECYLNPDESGLLVEGQEFLLEVNAETREQTLAEIAEQTYRGTIDFQKVADAVIAAHEARKAGAK